MSEPNAIHPVDGSLSRSAEPRLRGQNFRILALLKENRIVMNAALVRVAFKYSSRIADIRGRGYEIEKVSFPDSESRGVYGYTLTSWSPYSKLGMLPAVETIVNEVRGVADRLEGLSSRIRVYMQAQIDRLHEIANTADVLEQRRSIAIAQAKRAGNEIVHCEFTPLATDLYRVIAKTRQGWWMRRWAKTLEEGWMALREPVKRDWLEELPVLSRFGDPA